MELLKYVKMEQTALMQVHIVFLDVKIGINLKILGKIGSSVKTVRPVKMRPN